MSKSPARNSQSIRKKKVSKIHKEFVYLCSCCAGILLLLLATVNLRLFNNQAVLGISTETSSPDSDYQREIAFWQNFLAANPSYVEGWIELGTLAYYSKNDLLAQESLDKAKSINPNDADIVSLEELLSD
jgi:cytochrome c-type biogenesis protein CcmH/NrfG